MRWPRLFANLPTAAEAAPQPPPPLSPDEVRERQQASKRMRPKWADLTGLVEAYAQGDRALSKPSRGTRR